jgi:ligand-binding sensor domain-containing protein/putative methionine-R-sulfoxide reductase with GAF domain
LAKKIAILLLFFTGLQMQAQPPAFYHLSTAEGLNDNNVITSARDRDGILWVGTSEGLSSFDGNRITSFYKQYDPGLFANSIQWIEIDHHNQIWLRTQAPFISMLDENRNFQLFTVGDTTDKSSIKDIFSTISRGMVIIKGKEQYTLKDKTKKHFERTSFFEKGIIPADFNFAKKLIGDKVLFYGEERLVVADYASLKVLLNIPLNGLGYAVAINENEILAFTTKGDIFYRINISQRKVITTYPNLKDQYGKPIEGDLRKMTRIDENNFIITSRFSGLYYLNLATLSLRNYRHDPLDARSIGGNNTYNITYDTSGYLFVTTQTSGLHYYNNKQVIASSRPYFINEKGEVFDGYIQWVCESGDSLLWLGAQDRLILWNRNKETAIYVPLLINGQNISGRETIRYIFEDENGLMWVGTTRYGVVLMDRDMNIRQVFQNNSKDSLAFNWINSIVKDHNGNIWVATLGGTILYSKKEKGYTPSLVHKGASLSLFTDRDKKMWIGTETGIFRYNSQLKQEQHFHLKNGLINNRIDAIEQDNDGNMYAGTAGGLSVIHPDNSITNYSRGNGLRNDRCEGILKDANGFMWIGNLNCVLRFHPATKTFTVFEEGNGFNHSGFRMRCAYKSRSGEMFWGTDKGLVWFHPQTINISSSPLKPVVYSLQTSDSTHYFTQPASLRFPFNTSVFTFYFSSGELSGGKKIQMRYLLSGYDEEWRIPSINGQASYSKLPPGSYDFKIKASTDGLQWQESSFHVSFIVNKPWWQQIWFRLLSLLLTAAILAAVYRFYKKRKKIREINTTIEYFANSSYEHSSVEDILWDISRNCISRLGFEDCVIYLADEEKKTLVQKAAYGPKSPKPFEIANPIEITFGKGIVGHVVQTGKALIVNDTTKDSRYIVDDENRLSEITVPIIHEEKVIGIIDSENSKKHFFTKQHLQALQTIASLCSTKISRALAMDAMKKSQLELMELNVKMAESKFMNLRLQMNPHFLFNSLSAIQHLIVSQQTTRAYKYLTVFSNFLRSLLNFAEKNFIPLDEEVKILNMYIELESLRFDQSFSWEIKADETLLHDEVLVPSLMVQPFAENAIWHGLLHKEGEKKLSIFFSSTAEEYLTCVIEDNGVGRERSASIQQNKISSMVHESKGISIIRERLQLLQQKTGKPASVELKDLYTTGNAPAGTRVIITIPYYNPEET